MKATWPCASKGKYEGTEIRTIPTSYLSWMLRCCPDLPADERSEIVDEIRYHTRWNCAGGDG